MTLETSRLLQSLSCLRKMGFGAHAGSGIGGLTNYSILAVKAGIGTFGRSGLIITPENGPRHRLGVVYTNIRNLPTIQKEDFSWVEKFCEKCGKCVRVCPANAIYNKPLMGDAIYNKPLMGDNGYKIYIDPLKCGAYFSKNYACGICIKECPFNIAGYEKIKDSFFRGGTHGKN
jgi:epoxyqueuosine reductase